MRFGFLVIAALFFGAFAAHFLLEDKGYVLINFRGYAVEMSVPAMLLVLAALYLLVRIIVRIWRLPRRLGQAVGARQAARTGDKLTKGLIQMAEGNWAKGERLLGQGTKRNRAPLINYLMAARAAQLQGAHERRDEWLKLAYEDVPEAEAAVLLTQAELQVAHGQNERALATLRKINEVHPNQPLGVALLARVYQALGDWKALLDLLPDLPKSNLPEDAIVDMAADTVAATTGEPDLTSERLGEIWSRIPKPLQKAPQLIGLRARALNKLENGAQAERELRAALGRDWNEGLVLAYGKLTSADQVKQLKRVENWLKSHPEDAALLLTAARLCMVNELWGKARSYLESSLAIRPRADAYQLYGRLLARLGEGENAALAYRSGLSLLTEDPSVEIPALSPPAAD
jgi:HemY protein